MTAIYIGPFRAATSVGARDWLSYGQTGTLIRRGMFLSLFVPHGQENEAAFAVYHEQLKLT